MVRSAAGHEMMAGFSNGNGACARPSTDVQTPGLRITRPTEETRPTTPPLTAPLDVVTEFAVTGVAREDGGEGHQKNKTKVRQNDYRRKDEPQRKSFPHQRLKTCV
jgi:hypothetical protein